MKSKALLPLLRSQECRTIFWSFLGLTLVLMFVMNITGMPLNTKAAPYGIVSFELAGSVDRSIRILESWGSVARERAAFNLGLDFLFIPSYVTMIALGCILASEALLSRQWPLAFVGNFLAWGVALAGILDLVENIALTLILFCSVSRLLPAVAAWCAAIKFGFVFLGLVYLLYGGSVSLVIRRKVGNLE